LKSKRTTIIIQTMSSSVSFTCMYIYFYKWKRDDYLVDCGCLVRGGIPRSKFVNPKKLNFPSLCLTQSCRMTWAGMVAGMPSSCKTNAWRKGRVNWVSTSTAFAGSCKI
jgi:hypothetical protein